MDGDNRQINRDRGGMHPGINYSVSEKSHQMNSGCRSKLFSDSTVKLALAWDSIIGTAGEWGVFVSAGIICFLLKMRGVGP